VRPTFLLKRLLQLESAIIRRRSVLQFCYIGIVDVTVARVRSSGVTPMQGLDHIDIVEVAIGRRPSLVLVRFDHTKVVEIVFTAAHCFLLLRFGVGFDGAMGR
jgi:hypothetical protein